MIEIGTDIEPIYYPVNVPAERPVNDPGNDQHYYIQVMKADRMLNDEFASFYEESGSAYLRIKIFPLFKFDGIINEQEVAYMPDCLASTEFTYVEQIHR